MADSDNGAGEVRHDFSDLVGRYLVFRLDEVNYGLQVTVVQEIVQMTEITKIPKAPDYIRGILSLRGKTMPAIELRRQFKLQSVEDTGKTCIIVVDIPTPHGSLRAGLIVDEVAEVLDLAEEHFAPPPDLGREERGRFIRAIGVVGENITVLLDLEKLLGLTEMELHALGSQAHAADAEPEAGAEQAPPPEAPPATGEPRKSPDEPEIVRHVTGLLRQMPEGSPEYEATSGMLEKIQEFIDVVHNAGKKELDEMLAKFDLSEQPLLQELGKLVRRFHTEITTVGTDFTARLGQIAEHDMASATQRLEHIMEMTEEAANTTMTLAEGMIVTLSSQEAPAATILKRMDKALAAKNLEPEANRIVKQAAKVLKQKLEADSAQQDKLTEILMAQGYQDLTGQVVQKIVSLLNQLEGELLELVKVFGTTKAAAQPDGARADTGPPALEGPLSEKSEVKQSQDEVDSLLDSLGF